MEKLEFEFAKYTEITDLVFETRPDLKEAGYVRFFICPDVNTFWLIRIMENINSEYEKDDGCYLMERNNIDKEYKSETLTTSKVKKIIENDELDCWDSEEEFDIDDLIDMLDDGFGINNLQ